MRAWIATVLICSLVSGCAQTRTRHQTPAVVGYAVSEAPSISLNLTPQPTVSLVSNRLEPEFTWLDERPVFEKSYYPGNTDPHHWHDAVTILPLESFQPDIEELVRQRVLQSLKSPMDYDKVTLRVTSFYVALDERERGRTELLKDFRKWDDDREQRESANEQQRREGEAAELHAKNMQRELGLAIPDDNDNRFGDFVAKGIFRTAVVKPVKNKMLRAAQARKLKVAPQTLPPQLAENKQPGWNGQCDAELILTSGKTTPVTLSISARTHTAKDPVEDVSVQIRNTVMTLVDQISHQIDTADFN